MNTLRDLTGGSISMRKFAEQYGFKDPISLNTLFTMRREINSSAISLKADDVKGWLAMSISRDGTCVFAGHLYDDGTVIGDNYAAALNVNHPKIGALVKAKTGSIGHGDTAPWNHVSSDSWIKSNWATLIDGQTSFHAHLHVNWNLPVGNFIKLLIEEGVRLSGGAAAYSCFKAAKSIVETGSDADESFVKCLLAIAQSV